MTWQDVTLAKWTEETLGMDAEETMLETLRMATAMMEAALLIPEWGVGFIRAARSDGLLLSAEAQGREIAEMFPVGAGERGLRP